MPYTTRCMHRDARIDAVLKKSNIGSEVHREVYRPWVGNAEVENKASDESREEGDVRQGRRGKGKASQEGCQVLCSGSAEEEHLISYFQVCAWTLHASQVRHRREEV